MVAKVLPEVLSIPLLKFIAISLALINLLLQFPCYFAAPFVNVDPDFWHWRTLILGNILR